MNISSQQNGSCKASYDLDLEITQPSDLEAITNLFRFKEKGHELQLSVGALLYQVL